MIYTLSEGTIQYQKAQKKLTEEKIIDFLLKSSSSLPSSRQIWKKTKIYKNNVKPILDKLLSEGKVLKFKKIETVETYQTKKQEREWQRILDENLDANFSDFIIKRVVTKDVFIPNFRNKEVFDYAKKNHMHLFFAFYDVNDKKAGKKFLKTLNNRYSDLPIEEAFVRIRGSRIDCYDTDLAIIHSFSIGTSLIFLLHITKNLPSRIPSKKTIEKKIKSELSESMFKQFFSRKNVNNKI